MKSAPEMVEDELERKADPKFEEDLDLMDEYEEKFSRKETKKIVQVPKKPVKKTYED